MILTLLLAVAAQPPMQRYCGWLDNPTPGNWWLRDRTRQWTLATQGAPGAPGWEDVSFEGKQQSVETNGSYGYSCACVTMRGNPRTGRVEEVRTVRFQPLRICRADRRLPAPD